MLTCKRMFAVVMLAWLLAACGTATTPMPSLPTSVPTLTTMLPTTAPPTAAPVPATADGQAINAATAARLEQVAVLDLPDSFVNAIAFSPDGHTMFTGDRNGEVLVWERDTWEKTTYLPAQSTFTADDDAGYSGGPLALSPDGNLIVTDYGEEGMVTGRDREGQALFTFEYGAPVYSMAISPDGKFLAVGGLKGNVIIFDLETRQPAADLAGDYEYISNLVFSRASRTLLVCYERPSNVMKIWDTTTWQETATFTHVTERVDYHDVLFSPDDQELVIATTENVEIKFLDLATKQVVKEISEHTRAPYQLAFSPDGSLLASASDDGTLRLWNLETGDRVQVIQTNREAGAVAFSPDGALIAVSVWGEGVQVWAISPAAISTPTPLPPLSGSDTGLITFTSDRDGNDEIYIMPAPGPQAQVNTDGSDQRNLTNHPACDDDPHWSPDGSLIAFSSDRSGNYDIYIMDADGANLRQLTRNPAVDAHPTWSPDGARIAFVSLRDGNAEIYVMNAAGSDLGRLTHNPAPDDEPDWSPDGTQIAFASSAGDDANVYVMDSDGSGRQQLTDADAHDFFPRWSPDGTQIVFLSQRDGGAEEIYVMDSDGSHQRRLTTNDAFDGAPSWSPDGAQLVFASDRDGNHELYVLSVPDGMDSDGTNVRRLTDNSAADREPAWRPMLQATTNVPALAVISADTVEQVEHLHTLSGHSDRVVALAFSGDGAHIASASRDRTIKLWDTRSRQEVYAFSINEAGINSIAFSPDGGMLASAEAIWDVESRQVLHTLGGGRQVPGHVAFSPDGALLAVGGGRPVKLWDVASGQAVRTFDELTNNDTFTTVFSPDGTWIATSGYDGVITLWDVPSGQVARILSYDREIGIHSVVFSPDGRLLASGGTDPTIRLWDVASGQVIRTLSLGDGLYGLAFSLDGHLLASAGCDRTVKLWDVENGRMLRSLPHDDELMAVAFSPDGTLLASGGYDHQIYLWGVSR